MIPLYDKNPRENTPVVCWLLIGVNVLIFLFEMSLPLAARNNLISNFALIPADHYSTHSILHINILPFFTSQFLHGGWEHIIGNMLFLFVFGDNVEDRFGHWGFLLFYLISGFVSGLLMCSFAPNSMVPTIGASGAISGVMGAYLIMFPKAGILTFIPPFFFLTLPAWFLLGEWFVFQLIFAQGDQQMQVGVAWWAHVGGFLFGALATLALSRNRTVKPERQRP